MKIISLNTEGNAHHETVLPFLEQEDADVITLQEAAEDYVIHLENMGYHVTFLPRVERVSPEGSYTDGSLLASREAHQSITHYCFDPSEEVLTQNKEKKRTTNKQGLIVAEVLHNGETYTIATTHFTWTPEGNVASLQQQKDMRHLLFFCTTKNRMCSLEISTYRGTITRSMRN